MKNRDLIIPLLGIAIMLTGSLSFAQNNQYRNQDNKQGNPQGLNDERGLQGYCSNIPDLTDEQQESINELRTVHLKKANLLRAQIQEKRAQLNTLRLGDKPDMDEINRTIDETTDLRAELMKEREAHHQAIRAQLNDDQKVWFDNRQGRGKGFGQSKGFGPQGPCRFDRADQGPERGRRFRQFR